MSYTLKMSCGAGVSSCKLSYVYNGATKTSSGSNLTITFDEDTKVSLTSITFESGYGYPATVTNRSTGGTYNMASSSSTKWSYNSRAGGAPPSVGYTLTATATSNSYTYTFKNSSDYTIVLRFSSDVTSTTSLTLSPGGSRTLTCEPGDINFDVARCTVDYESGYADCIYWQRTSPTTGTKYCLDSTSGSTLSLRSTGNATYTFTVSGYSPAPVTYTITFRHYKGSSLYETTSSEIEDGTIITLSNYAQSYSGYAYSYATNSSGSTITRLTVTGNATVYMYYTASTFTVTFRHYLDGSFEESTSVSVTSGSSITIANYAESYTGYEYDHAENSSGTTITKLTVTANTTVYLYYTLIKVTVTFRHYRGGELYTTTSTTVNYGTTVTVSSYKISSIPNCVYDSASVSSFTATAARTVSLYYIFAWTYAKKQGGDWNLTATEWNNLCAFVNAQRSSAYSFTSAVKGNVFTAAMYNQMVSAIGTGTRVASGDTITAALMNALVTNANNM